MSQASIPVITIDGQSSCGKGTIAHLLAKELKWHCLDSGAIYRAIAWAVLYYKIRLEDTDALRYMLGKIKIEIDDTNIDCPTVKCDGEDITQVMRSDAHSSMASQASALAIVRESVLQFQRDFQRHPGLVADGRDMGTVVFPNAQLKFFLKADLSERAKRRYQQLHANGMSTKLEEIEAELAARDKRDTERVISPTKPADDAIILETTLLSVEQVFAKVMAIVNRTII